MSSSFQLPNKRLFFIAILTSIGGSFHFGYQQAIINPAQTAFMEFLNESLVRHYKSNLNGNIETIWSAIAAIFYIGSIFGAFSISPIADKFGRKKGLILSYILSLISVILAIISKFITSVELYTISRVTMGYSISLNLGLSGLYLNECSPKECRGFISSSTGVFVGVGVLVGAIVAMPQLLGTFQLWWIIYLIEAVIYVFILAIFPFSHETPGFLLKHGRDEEAKKAIQFFYNCQEKDILMHKEEISKNIKHASNTKPIGMLQVWQDPISIRGTVVGMANAFGTSFCGMTINNAYSVEIIKSIGLSETNASFANLGINFVLLVSIVCSSFALDKFGRRPIMLTTYFGLLLTNIGIFVIMLLYSIFHTTWLGILLIIMIAIFMVFFAFGPGVAMYFLTTELVSQNYRSSAQSWSMLVNMCSRTVLLAGYLPLTNGIGQSWSELALFVVPMIFAWLIFYFMLPETKGRNFDQVLEEVEKLPSIKNCCRRRKMDEREVDHKIFFTKF